MNARSDSRRPRWSLGKALFRTTVCGTAALCMMFPVAPEVLAAPPPPRGRASSPSRTPTGSTPSTAMPLPVAPGTPRGAAAPATGGELSGDEGPLAHNTCRKQPRGSKFRITLPKDAQVQDLINWMMSVSCQKFIVKGNLRSSPVTVLSPEPVTIEEAYAAFYAALETMGLTVEPSGKYFKIVEVADAKSKTLPVFGPGGRAPVNDRFVTQLIRVNSGNTSDVVGLLNKLKSKNGSVDSINDLVILTDTGSSVRRLLRIVREVDSEAGASNEKIFFFQMQYADVEETAETIREIFGEKDAKKSTSRSKGGKAKPSSEDAGFSRVVVDDRTGTLIIVALDSDFQVIKRLIQQLDVPLAGGGGKIRVVRLKNADPEEVAQVLQQLGSGAQSQRSGNNRRGGGRQNAPQTPSNPTAELFSGDIKVTPDPATRSLVILASATDFKALYKVIQELDVPRKQVYIEVYLLELTVTKDISGGVGGHFGSTVPTADGDGIGFVSNAPTANQSSISISPSLLTGLAAGVIGPQVANSAALLGTDSDIPAFGVVIQALQAESDVNFVAEPHLYTADNKEASIEVGRNVPTQGGLAFPGGGQGGGLVPVQSVQRQDVTLNVKVTPHVNDSKTVSLDIEMENNDIESIDQTLGVTTTKRRLKLEQVVARDDQPVVLGGLMQEVERESTNQIPGLGSIPLLGWLFKSKTKTREKINLLMILVPHILETPDDVRRIHERRMKERLEFLERYTAFKRRDLSLNVNYRKKAGLLASINKEAERMASEDEWRRQADLELERHETSGEIGLSPKTFDAPEPSTSSDTGTRSPTSAPRSGKKPGRRNKPK